MAKLVLSFLMVYCPNLEQTIIYYLVFSFILMIGLDLDLNLFRLSTM